MGEVVNRTRDAAERWQRPVLWLRMNVGYLRAEAPYVRGGGQDVADIEQLSREFEPAFEVFCDEEMSVFVAARRFEAEMISRDDFVAKVRALQNCFRPWIETYHSAVMARRQADDRGLGLGLLHGCGIEVMNAHRAFVDAVEAYAVSA